VFFGFLETRVSLGSEMKFWGSGLFFFLFSLAGVNFEI